jgi:hypothetical protein
MPIVLRDLALVMILQVLKRRCLVTSYNRNCAGSCMTALHYVIKVVRLRRFLRPGGPLATLVHGKSRVSS